MVHQLERGSPQRDAGQRLTEAATGRLDSFLDLVERLDGLPRHIALHPCGIVLSDTKHTTALPI